MVAWRREMHLHPEVAHHEEWTSRFVRDRLDEIGIGWRHPVGSTGVVGEIVRDVSLPWVALRADFDALPIQEESGLEFSSRRAGLGHLCGHDGHTAMLLGAAGLLGGMRDRLPCNVRLLFQHAEEVNPGGAVDFLAAGCLEGVAYCYGLHNHPGLALGSVGVSDGPVMASSIRFDVRWVGRGGHGAAPHQCADPVVAAAAFIQAAQTLVSRRISPFDPCVVSVCSVHAGEAFNVIPESAVLAGTVRVMSREAGDLVRDGLAGMARGVAEAYGVKAEFHWAVSTPPLVNHPAAVKRLRAGAVAQLGSAVQWEASPPTMAAEDFAFLADAVPSCYFFLGTRDEDAGVVWPWHSPRFLFHEEAMPVGAALLASAALHAEF